MSLVSKPCAQDIYRILADDKKKNGNGVDLDQIKEELAPRYHTREIATMLGEMELLGVADTGWAKGEDERYHRKYTISNKTEWSALFANTLGYDPIALGIPENLANK